MIQQVPFEMVRTDIGGTPALVVYGDIDIVTAPRLHEALGEIIVADPPLLLVDLANVTFVDSSGLGAIVVASRHLEERGGVLRLVAVPSNVRAVLEVSGLSERLLSDSDREGEQAP